MAGVIHMPCGCPYPKLGDRRPCEHGYPGDEDEDESSGAEALAEWHAWWLPQWAAVSEGFCPTHKIPLEPVTCAPGWAGGHCPQCRAYWGDDLADKSVRWTLDHEPWNHDRPVRPEWVLA